VPRKLLTIARTPVLAIAAAELEVAGAVTVEVTATVVVALVEVAVVLLVTAELDPTMAAAVLDGVVVGAEVAGVETATVVDEVNAVGMMLGPTTVELGVIVAVVEIVVAGRTTEVQYDGMYVIVTVTMDC